MLAPCGVVCFENTLGKGFINFCPNPWFTLLYRVNATISNISVIWFNEDITRLQRHHARIMWICMFRAGHVLRTCGHPTKGEGGWVGWGKGGGGGGGGALVEPTHPLWRDPPTPSPSWKLGKFFRGTFGAYKILYKPGVGSKKAL